MNGVILNRVRHQRKIERAAAIAGIIERLCTDGREYRIRFAYGKWYAEYRSKFFWHKLAERCGMDCWYDCDTRDRALELIADDKARIQFWDATPAIESVA